MSNYPSKQTPKLSIQQESTISYQERVVYLHVSSADRDPVKFPSPSQYIIDFDREFKNIKRIELIQAHVPSTNGVDNEPYLILKIDEIDRTIYSKNALIDDSFAILQMTAPLNGYIQIKKDIHEKVVKDYITPLATLSKFSMSIYKQDGTLFNFGSDTNPVNLTLQNMFIFKITTIEKSRENIGFRALF
jgi:hypothetical protein